MLIQAQMRVYDHQAASAAAIETVAFRTDAVLTSEDKLDAMKVGVDSVAECVRVAVRARPDAVPQHHSSWNTSGTR